MIPVVLRANGALVPARLEEPALGRGGEGSIYRLRPAAGTSPPSLDAARLPPLAELVAKIYHPGDPQRAARRSEKIAAMLAAAPATAAICWPLAAVLDAYTRAPLGFAMVALDTHAFRTWAQLARPGDRRSCAPGFSVRYALAAARNLAVALDAVHRAGHVLGDVNESNLFVGADATVRIVDADSAQVRGHGGHLYRCEVGKPEYCAPELAGQPFTESVRTPASDTYAYAILVFQMLAGGAHPADGIPADLSSEPPDMSERLARRWTPGLLPAPGCPLLPVPRVPARALPSRLRPVLAQALEADPARRPDLATLRAVLDDVGAHLAACARTPLHAYDRRDGSCGWCAHVDAGQPDAWSPSSAGDQAGLAEPAQQAMPALSFAAPVPAPAIRRAAPSSPGLSPAGPTSGPAAPIGPHRGGPVPPGSIAAQLAVMTAAGGSASGSLIGPASGPGARRRTLLRRADGTVTARPPLLELALRQPLLALGCAWRELPEAVKPRPISSPPGTRRFVRRSALLGAFLGALVILLGGGAGLLAVGAASGLPAGRAVPITCWLGTLAVSLTDLGVLLWRIVRRRGLRAGLECFSPRDTGAVLIAASSGMITLLVVAAVVAVGLCLAASAGLNALFAPRRTSYVHLPGPD